MRAALVSALGLREHPPHLRCAAADRKDASLVGRSATRRGAGGYEDDRSRRDMDDNIRWYNASTRGDDTGQASSGIARGAVCVVQQGLASQEGCARNRTIWIATACAKEVQQQIDRPTRGPGQDIEQQRQQEEGSNRKRNDAECSKDEPHVQTQTQRWQRRRRRAWAAVAVAKDNNERHDHEDDFQQERKCPQGGAGRGETVARVGTAARAQCLGARVDQCTRGEEASDGEVERTGDVPATELGTIHQQDGKADRGDAAQATGPAAGEQHGTFMAILKAQNLSQSRMAADKKDDTDFKGWQADLVKRIESGRQDKVIVVVTGSEPVGRTYFLNRVAKLKPNWHTSSPEMPYNKHLFTWQKAGAKKAYLIDNERNHEILVVFAEQLLKGKLLHRTVGGPSGCFQDTILSLEAVPDAVVMFVSRLPGDWFTKNLEIIELTAEQRIECL